MDDKLRDEIREELERVGIDPENIEEMQADMAYVRRGRQYSERFTGWLRIGIAGAILAMFVQIGRYFLKGEW